MIFKVATKILSVILCPRGNGAFQFSGLLQTGRGTVSVDSVTVTEFYSEKESERPPRVERRVCVCTVCVYMGAGAG